MIYIQITRTRIIKVLRFKIISIQPTNGNILVNKPYKRRNLTSFLVSNLLEIRVLKTIKVINK